MKFGWEEAPSGVGSAQESRQEGLGVPPGPAAKSKKNPQVHDPQVSVGSAFPWGNGWCQQPARFSDLIAGYK